MSTPNIVRAFVTQASPLRVRVEGPDVTALSITPDNYAGTLTPGDVVLLARYPKGNVEVLARLGGPPNPNLIINGDFRINQRGYTSGLSQTSGLYGFDRWSFNTNGAMSLSFSAKPSGNMVAINVLSGTYALLVQVVEAANVPAGPVTFSWEGTAKGSLSVDGGATWVVDRASSPITVIADGTSNVVVRAIVYTAETGATFGNVKLETGTVATPFQTTDYGEELSKCLRYFNAITDGRWLGFYYATGTVYFTIPYPTMRAAPTMTFTNGTGRWRAVSVGGGNDLFDTVAGASISPNSAWMLGTGNVVGTQNQPCIVNPQSGGAAIFLNAEL